MARARLIAVVAALAIGGGVFVWDRVDDAVREVTLPLRHEDSIRQQARQKRLDPALIAGVIYAESKFQDNRTSSAGAEGLMQILPDTARFIARRSGGTRFEVDDLGNPDINIRYGSYYLRYLLDRYHGNTVAAVASYNAGHSHVDEWGGDRLEQADIRFDETREYVHRVLAKRLEYRRHYARELGLAR